MKIIGFNLRGGTISRKRESFALVGYFVAVDLATGKEPVTLRIYRPHEGSTALACVWINAGDAYGYGSGTAGGGGYHKASAAAESAFRAAGVEFDVGIAGAGDSAIRSAIMAVCASLGYPACHIVDGGN